MALSARKRRTASATKDHPRPKYHVKRGDQVEVICGKHKRERGEILQVDRKRGRVVVKGVNLQHRHTKPKGQSTQGGIFKVEGSVHISNVKKLS